MGANGNGRVRFGDFEFDSQSGKLFRGGVPVRIQPQPLRVLQLLVERAGETISREQLRSHIWDGVTFVEFDQGLNYCIRQIRIALSDNAVEPAYIETLPKQGYRFIAEVIGGANGATADAAREQQPGAQTLFKEPAGNASNRNLLRRLPISALAVGVFALLGIAGAAVYLSFRTLPAPRIYTQLTDFTDSAMAPALSPDGRMLAFIRGDSSFLTADQIYVKVLPNGEAKRLTDDPREKYSLAFSPDGSQIAYSVIAHPYFDTYTVSVLGGDSRLLLKNAAGLTWLDQRHVLFSQIRSGIHLGVVTGTVTRENFREIYFPPHERAMAHYSYASPDRKAALVVEMNEIGWWTPCRLVPLNGKFPGRSVGPPGACTSAGWSPDGSWMYFTAYLEGRSHLWRQRFPNGQPEQVTSGVTEEEGVAVEHDGRSVITSVGTHESAIWIHDAAGDRPLSSEGEIFAAASPPSFSPDDKLLYYLLVHQSADSGPELWRMMVDSGKSEALFPGTSMLAFDISPDGKQVVYVAPGAGGKSSLWIAPVDRSSPARQIGHSGETSPHFGPRGQVLFQIAEGNFNYLEQMNPDGSERSKIVPYPILDIHSISPGRRWIIAGTPIPGATDQTIMAIPSSGGPPHIVCESDCNPIWSSNGNFLFVPVEGATRTSPGRSLAIPVGPGESLPQLPPQGIPPQANASIIPGAQSVARADLVPGRDPSHYAYVNTTVHRNLYRISLP
jgi:DNA-binding winged helix-turn-helix (wHTH) protein/Tol biopolymer transport system component